MRLKPTNSSVRIAAAVLCLYLSGCAWHIQSLVDHQKDTSPEQQSANQTLPQAQSLNTFELTNKQYHDVVGHIAQTTIQQGDTLSQIARRYDVGYQDIMRANPGLNPDQLQVGRQILISTLYVLPPPDKREGIVINIPELHLYDFTQDGQVSVYPVALGRQGWRTPVANTYVYRKQTQPTWHVPESIRKHHKEKYGEELPRAIGPGPNNPLGEYAVYLHKSGYLIHGTNNPSSVGRFISSGCIRMYSPDIKQVYQHVSQGTPVHIMYSPNKAGWLDDKLYISAYKPVEHDEDLYQIHHISLQEALEAAKKRQSKPVDIDHDKKQKIKELGYGIPAQIGQISQS